MKIKDREIFPIGIGTWGIGGFATRNPKNDDKKQIEALVYMLQKGMNFIETDLWRAEGKCVELVSKAFKESKIPRNKIFITQMISTISATTIKEASNEIIRFKKEFDIDYVDSIQFSPSSFHIYGENEAYSFLDNSINKGDCKFVSLTNGSKDHLAQFFTKFKQQVFAHEVGLNFEIRENIDFGTVDFAQKYEILNVITQPLRRNRSAKRNWPLLIKISEKYNKTQNQIIINWLVRLGVLPIIKSESIEHINENIAALDFDLSVDDFQAINDFRPPKYISPKVFYGEGTEGVRIDQLSNVFDEEYDKSLK